MTNTTGNLVGYARVSTDTQRLDLQQDALERIGVIKLFTDLGVSGTKASRPGLDECLSYLREGDTLVVYSLSRLARSTKNLLALVEQLDQRGVKLRSITESIDTSGAFGTMMLTMIAAISTLERDLLAERTRAGLASARARGKSIGRPKKLGEREHKMVRALYDANDLKIAEIAEQFGVSEGTIFRSLRSTRLVEVV